MLILFIAGAHLNYTWPALCKYLGVKNELRYLRYRFWLVFVPAHVSVFFVCMKLKCRLVQSNAVGSS